MPFALDRTTITSSQNPTVKAARALQDALERKKEGLLLIEGHRHIAEAMAAGAVLRQCFYLAKTLSNAEQEFVAMLVQKGVDVISVSDNVLQAISNTVTPQAMVAVAQAPVQMGEALLAQRSLLLVADEVRDPGNLGTMMRTAAAVGAGLIMTAGCADYTQPKVVRSSAGALYSLPIWAKPTVEETAKHLQVTGFRTYLCDASGDTPLYAANFIGPVAVVIGNEGHGPAPHWLETGSQVVYIPMPGRAESLNAAISAAVVLYEALRQRQLT